MLSTVLRLFANGKSSGEASGALSERVPSNLLMAVRMESLALTVPAPETIPVSALPVTVGAAMTDDTLRCNKVVSAATVHAPVMTPPVRPVPNPVTRK